MRTSGAPIFRHDRRRSKIASHVERRREKIRQCIWFRAYHSHSRFVGLLERLHLPPVDSPETPKDQ